MLRATRATGERCGLAVAVLTSLVSAWPLLAQRQIPGPRPQAKSAAGPVVEARLSDRSTIKVTLREERVELVTPYGKLSIPMEDIRRIEFGLRLSADEQKRIAMAVRDLGDKDYRKRQAAAADLQALREKAYPALLQAAKGKDAETVRRAEQLLEKAREAVPQEDLEIPSFDVVYTDNSTIAGRITGPTLRVHTLAFGEQQLRLADVRSLRLKGAAQEVAGGALPDPGTLVAFQAQTGKTLIFRVTGPVPGGGQLGVYGTDVYTMDSSLAWAAVHAGALRPGETGLVRVTILGQQPMFQGSVRNGITSMNYGTWPGYRVEKRRNAGGR
jgi:hypothetical protein